MNPHIQNSEAVPYFGAGDSFDGGENGDGEYTPDPYGDGENCGYGCTGNGQGDCTGLRFGDGETGNGEGNGSGKWLVFLAPSDPDLWVVWSAEQELG